ncbi:MAG: helix-hairpin-helix domain-containing protein [Phycisphaerae bacterium]|nr:helix-hairpin-helix domain-containing protein [Phycisphaerae bacterium]
MTHPRAKYEFAFTPVQVRALCVLLAAGLPALGASAFGRVWFGGTIPVVEAHVAAAREFLDPNTASDGSLERLPGVGPTRAGAILQYRREKGPGAFRTARDLEKVRGIGPGTVRKIAPHLAIPRGDI